MSDDEEEDGSSEEETEEDRMEESDDDSDDSDQGKRIQTDSTAAEFLVARVKRQRDLSITSESREHVRSKA